MKIECNKTKLLKSILKADKVVSKNSSLPVLSCLVLETEGKDLFVKATNLEIGLKIKIPAKILKEGAVAIPSGVFVSYINNLSADENLVLEVKENILFISGSKGETKINILPVDDFPSIPNILDAKSCKISSRELLEGLRSVWYAASVSSMKPELSSVYIYSEGSDLIFVATDSFRLAEKKVHTKVDSFESVLIPQKNVLEIIRVFEDCDDDVLIKFSEDKVSFELENEIFLITRVVDGNFPDYKQIIPKESTTEVTVLKNDLINTLKISNLFSDNFNQITLVVNSENSVLEAISKNPERGETRNIINSTIKGDSLEINFNQKYMNDSFGSIKPESLVIYFNGNGKPIIMKGVGDSSFQYLVMPLNK